MNGRRRSPEGKKLPLPSPKNWGMTFWVRLDHLKITIYSNTKAILGGPEEALFISLRGYLMMIV